MTAAVLTAVHALAYNGAANPHAEHLQVAADWAVYVVGGLMILAGALGVVLFRNPVHCALSLVVTLFGIALEFIDLNADFLAAVQIIVYAGAIVILFLFVIMFLGVDRRERVGAEKFPAQRPVAILLGLAMFILVLLLTTSAAQWTTGAHSLVGSLGQFSGPNGGPEGDVARLGQVIYTRFLLPFEMTSALLVIAIVAAVVLARTRHRVAGELSEQEQKWIDETAEAATGGSSQEAPAGASSGEGSR